MGTFGWFNDQVIGRWWLLLLLLLSSGSIFKLLLSETLLDAVCFLLQT